MLYRSSCEQSPGVPTESSSQGEPNSHRGLVRITLPPLKTYTDAYSYDYTLEPQVTLGTSYKWGMVSLSADLDLTEQEIFGVSMTDEDTYQELNDTTQAFGVGMEFDLWEWAQMQVGYRKDLQGYYDDIYTVGLGLSPYDVVSISLAGFYGKNDTYGASLQIGLKL